MPETTKSATIVAVLDAPPSSGAALTALAQTASWLEVRADLVGDLDPAWLRAHFAGRIL
jgi:hypothetical protein